MPIIPPDERGNVIKPSLCRTICYLGTGATCLFRVFITTVHSVLLTKKERVLLFEEARQLRIYMRFSATRKV